MFPSKGSVIFFFLLIAILSSWNTISANEQITTKGLKIKFGTPVLLRFISDVSSKTTAPGQWIDLEVAAPISVDGIEVIPEGTPAKGFTISSNPNNYGGRGGLLSIGNFYLILGGSQRIRLDGIYRLGGADKPVSLAIGYCCFLGFLIKGEDACVKKGQRFKAVLQGDEFVQ